jgi:hypothetical protein
MKTLNLKAWGKDHPITFTLSEYVDNGNLYVGMLTLEEGWPEPWSDLTVNLGVKCAKDCAFIDTNNNNGRTIIDWLIEHNLGDFTERVCKSGFCLYPEFRFNMDELMKYVTSDSRSNK